MHSGPHVPRRRPPWWPHDQAWPPPEGEGRHFSRAFPCRALAILAALAFLALVGCVTLGLIAVIVSRLAARLLSGPIPPEPGLPPLPEIARWDGPAVLLLVLLVLGLLLIGMRAWRRVGVPISELLEASERIAGGDYRARISERGPREMRAVARAFNGMATRLQEHDTRRRLLLADVTHELRTPLTVIQGNLEGLLDGIYPRDDEHLAPILEETRVLSRLIDDLRTLSLVETGALELLREPTDLGALAGETLASFRSQADAAGVTLALDVAGPVTPLDVDPARIREVLLNLLANALRYTPRGGRVDVRVEAPPHLPATVTVADTGRGIAPEELAHIFDRFYRSADSRGTGLGLTIAKNLIVAHQGEITAASVPEQGTTVRFTLPRAG